MLFNAIPIRLIHCCSGAPVEGVVVLTGTTYTIVVDLECIGSIQCFESINIVVTTAAA